MNKQSVLDFQEQLLSKFDEEVGSRGAGGVTTEGDVAQGFDRRLAVGYSIKNKSTRGKKEYLAEVRLQSGGGPAFEFVKNYAKNKDVNIQVIDFIRTPAFNEKPKLGHKLLRRRHPVLYPGLSICHVDTRAGTLGMLIEIKEGTAILSASHVIAKSGGADIGDWVYHPGKPDVSPLGIVNRVARLHDATELSKDEINEMDAAVAVLLNGIQHDGNRFPSGIGGPFEGKTLTNVLDAEEIEDLGPRPTVGKVGRSTGYTTGILTAINVRRLPVKTSKGNYSFGNVIEITWHNRKKRFSDLGDSGAIVFSVDAFAALGLHFAGDWQEYQKIGLSYSCHLKPILKHFLAEPVK